MNPWLAFYIGLTLGSFVGIMIAGLMRAAASDD